MASVTDNSVVKHFLDLLGGYWDYSVPLTTQWSLAIVPDAGNGQLFNTIASYTRIDLNSFIISPRVQSRLLNNKTQPNFDGLGLYYAQSVKLPKEGFSLIGSGVENMGGYLKGFVGGDRSGLSEKTLHIDFLETNLDFVDGLIRPWIIATSYKGLINTGANDSIKCTIMIQERTRQNGGDLKPLRKIHNFEGCVPYDVNEKTLQYASEPTEAPVQGITWAFESYSYDVNPL